MTTFPDMVYQLGGVPAGMSRLRDLWNKDNIYFVDGYAGSASNSGLRPDRALALPSQAISKCSAGASIYIRPIGVNYDQSSTSNYQFYTDDIVIPYGKSGIALIGAGEPTPMWYGGVAIRPSTVTDSLIKVRSNSNVIENMNLTLNGGTADQSVADGPQSIIELHRDGSVSRCYGNTIRGNRFAEDKSSPETSGFSGAVGAGTAQYLIVEDNIFEACLGGVTVVAHAGDAKNTYIRRNTFSGLCASRDCDVMISINSVGSNAILVADNMFVDGVPVHSGGNSLNFIQFVYQTAGTGLLANNYFATDVAEAAEDGADVVTSDTFFYAGLYYEGQATTAPYGLMTND